MTHEKALTLQTSALNHSQPNNLQELVKSVDNFFVDYEKYFFGSQTHLLTTTNPTNITNVYWQYLIKHDINAYEIDSEIHLTGKFYKKNDGQAMPLWCMQRIGQSTTILTDGREILIGGEYEDYYDADFCIYNDVIVKHPDGDIEIFGYPKHIFPPTDFHSATLINDDIWIIGLLGYHHDRQYQQTQIMKLNIHTYTITVLETINHIGLIYEHTAQYTDGAIIISGGRTLLDEDTPALENIDTWSLNVKTLIWQNISNKQWQCFYVGRQDFKYLHLWEYGCLDIKSDDYLDEYQVLTKELGVEPDREIFSILYEPPLEHEVDNAELEYNETAVFIDGVRVRYVDEGQTVNVYVEGSLPAHQLEIVQDNLKYKLEKLENFACMIKTL